MENVDVIKKSEDNEEDTGFQRDECWSTSRMLSDIGVDSTKGWYFNDKVDDISLIELCCAFVLYVFFQKRMLQNPTDVDKNQHNAFKKIKYQRHIY